MSPENVVKVLERMAVAEDTQLTIKREPEAKSE